MPEQAWRLSHEATNSKWVTNVAPDLQTIRKHAKLTKLLQTYPHVQYCLTEEYAENIKRTISRLNTKAHGSDGIPGGEYKILAAWIKRNITNMANQLKNGSQLPEEWVEGALVHIYKNKGTPNDCSAYRPIGLAQIIYKIWPKLITQRLTKITHILTSSNQFEYKEGLSTSDAIRKDEEHLRRDTPDTHILLMGLSKAFGAVNRTLLRAALYKNAYR